MKRLLIVLFLGLVSSVSHAAAVDVEAMIAKKAVEIKIDPNFAKAIIKVESNFNPRLKGSRGEYGLGQIRCGTARSVGFNGRCDQLSDIETNLEYSFRYLKQALELTNGDQCLAAALYSTGFGVKPRRSTYCKKVLAAM